jgi:DNA-binding MarR family transcriptional regulator
MLGEAWRSSRRLRCIAKIEDLNYLGLLLIFAQRDMATAESTTRTGAGKSKRRLALEARTWEGLSSLFFLQRPRMMALCREFDLFPPQLMVLKVLDEPRPMRDVATEMACDSSNLTGITDRLEERGLVRRTADPADRRVKLLVLTEDGEALRREVVNRLNQPPPGTVDSLSEAELRQLDALLRKALDS